MHFVTRSLISSSMMPSKICFLILSSFLFFFSFVRRPIVNNNMNVVEFRAELEKRTDKFDIIIGDLADPVEGGPCYQLYTKSFYEQILKPKLNDNGIFVTQVGTHFSGGVQKWHILQPNLTKNRDLLCRLDLQAFSPTRRSSPLFTTQLNRSSNVSKSN